MTKFRNVLTHTNYGPMIINIKDDTIGSCTSNHGYWGTADILLIQSILSQLYANEETLCLLDVGTNIGSHTLAFAQYPFKNVVVHGFEAQREIFYMVAGTIALNCLSNVFLHHVAVSNVSDVEIKIPKVDYSSKSNFGSYEIERAKHSDTSDMYVEGAYETIKTLRIDDLKLNHVKLIKIDVEGMEDKVVEGASDTIKSNRPVLYIETFKTNFEPVVTFLKNLNYLIFMMPTHDAVCIPKELNLVIRGATQIV